MSLRFGFYLALLCAVGLTSLVVLRGLPSEGGDDLAKFKLLLPLADLAEVDAAIPAIGRLLDNSVEPGLLYDESLVWGLAQPELFSRLLDHQKMEPRIEHWAQAIVRGGKSFISIERLGEQGPAAKRLVVRVRELEQQDRRTPLLAASIQADATLPRISKLSGSDAGLSWRGAALLAVESDCQLAWLTAGHNVADRHGRPRAGLEAFEIELQGERFQPTEIIIPAAPLEPVNDWALLVADKLGCGQTYAVEPLAVARVETLAIGGLDAGLYCFHTAKVDIVPRLYQEQCRAYPAEALDLYADQPAEMLAVHSCISEAGSSGCPLLTKTEQGYALLGTQIEGDNLTGAGIVRRVDAELVATLERLRMRLVEQDAGR